MSDPNGMNELPLRPASQVMRLERLGAFHQTRLSFVRSIVRKMMRERWEIHCTRFNLDDRGFGEAVYTIRTPGLKPGEHERYTIVFLTQYLADDRRSDRVIADAWDLSFALCAGEVNETLLADLRENIPLQEAGRCRPEVLVLSRANKSVRNFEHFVATLAGGRQPHPQTLANAGYLYRTTAVYGNGKFGLADFARLRTTSAFALPFSAQMFAVYMLRHFSVQQVNHLARCRHARVAVSLRDSLARYLGTGNATGLGMAPFLINHPQLINQWIRTREVALARVLHSSVPTADRVSRFIALARRAGRHIGEFHTQDSRQQTCNATLVQELSEVVAWVETDSGPDGVPHAKLWQRLSSHGESAWSLETQEMITSILLELYPELVDDLEEEMVVDESCDIIPQMSLAALKRLIESRYSWATAINFDRPEAQYFFWYRSAKKEEPRLGRRYEEPGCEKEIRVDVARTVHECNKALLTHLKDHPHDRVVHFLLRYPQYRGIVRRIQSLAPTEYGDIQDNLLDRSCLPIHLLRCKLSFFGCSKFDPKSALWLRITLFQGAPLVHELKSWDHDDWFLPTVPESPES